MSKAIAIAVSLVLALSSCVYPLCGVVIDVNRYDDSITIEDFNGNLWVWQGAEDWCVGDIAAMIMCDNGTSSIYDDTIVSITYNGYLMCER